MANISRGISLGATEQITNTKLHNLIDQATIASIRNADIASDAAIVDSKLADITSGGRVRGTALLNLQSIPSGAGPIPTANIPVLGATLLTLASIPNSALVPIALASWIDGASLRNLASIPITIGQFNYKTIVSSLASGGTIIYNGSNNFIGRSGGIFTHTPGSIVLATALTERTHLSSTYTKTKELTPVPFGGTVDIHWNYYSSTPNPSFPVYCRLYLNDVAVGIERSTNETTNVSISELAFSISPGDKIQIYSKVTRNATDNVYVKDLVIKSSFTNNSIEASGY